MSDIKELRNFFSDLKRLRYIQNLLRWDQRVYMPEGANKGRAELISYISKLAHQKLISDKTHRLIKKAELIDNLNIFDAAILREAKKEYQKAIGIPTELVEKIAKAATLGHKAWRKARETNQFSAFEPHLTKIINLQKQYADYIDLYPNRYDNLLDDYEPGVTADWLTKIFNGLKSRLLNLLEKIQDSDINPDRSFLTKKYSPEKQWAFCRDLIEKLHFNFDLGRIDKSVHPFTISVGSFDIRITSRIMENFLPSSVFGTIHECGHALYELGFMEKIQSTNLANPSSMGIHESQSRLWENIIGRSKEFWEGYWYEKLQNYFPENLHNISIDQFYKSINAVQPSLIRVEADELTYSLHIILRFELEKLIFADKVEPNELPDIWNEKMEELLFLIPQTDTEGILQDVHWSGGAFGYFPSYALGNLYAAQIYSAASDNISNLTNHVLKANYSPLLTYLREEIHQYGMIYPPRELITKVSGKPLDPTYFINYLEEKFAKMYNIN